MSDLVEVHVGDVVAVMWDDAYWERNDVPFESVSQLLDECCTVTWGVVCKVTDKSVWISGEANLSLASHRGITRIPKAWIVGVKIYEKEAYPDAG
jgi:hypothetical protein